MFQVNASPVTRPVGVSNASGWKPCLFAGRAIENLPSNDIKKSEAFTAGGDLLSTEKPWPRALIDDKNSAIGISRVRGLSFTGFPVFSGSFRGKSTIRFIARDTEQFCGFL